MRIHIIGTSGSGKSTFARNLSQFYQIPHFDLDHFYWDNEQNDYGTKMSKDQRNRKFHQALSQDAWIIEGVYVSWVQESLELADRIYLLDVSFSTCVLRILKRYLKRKMGLEEGKHETLKDLLELLRWMKKDHASKLYCFDEIQKKYPLKTVRLKTKADMKKARVDF